MSYQVNLEGLDTLRSAAWTQHEYTSAGQGFATGSCGPGAFDTGVLWLFRGEYDAAYSMLSTAMDSAVQASQRVHDTLAANLQTYLDDDAESSASLTELGLTIEALPTHEHGDYRPQEPMSNPSLSDLNPYLTGPEKVLKEAIDEIDTPSILQNPVEFPGGPTRVDTFVYKQLDYSYTEPVKLIGSLVDLANHSARTGSGMRDVRDYQDFIDRHVHTN